MPDIRYEVTTQQGDPIRPGDLIADSAGDIWVLEGVRATPGQPPHVIVTDGREAQSKDAALFGLHVHPCYADAGGPPATAARS